MLPADAALHVRYADVAARRAAITDFFDAAHEAQLAAEAQTEDAEANSAGWTEGLSLDSIGSTAHSLDVNQEASPAASIASAADSLANHPASPCEMPTLVKGPVHHWSFSKRMMMISTIKGVSP